EKIARIFNVDPKEVYVTSGGTESDNIAIKGVAFAQDRRNKIITSTIEHHAVLTSCEYLSKFGYEIIKVPVDEYGIIDLDFLSKHCDDQTLLVTIMHANNEVGTIEPIEIAAEIAHKHGAIFHTDAVQTAGKLPIDVKKMGIDLLSLSGHKIYGPKGIGVLIARKNVRFDPLSHGGHHEHRKRAGTENVPGIIGLGKALELAIKTMAEEEERIKRLRDRLWEGIRSEVSDLKLNGHPKKRLANTLNFSVRWVEGESLLLSLDQHGIAVSSGSACTSGSLEPSHVLLAMGIPHEIAHGSLRFSLGRFTKEEEIEEVIEVFPEIVRKLREMSPLYRK
ncbi:cysteine desulfurase NifS, partial [candidate division WOR-3 bacterium]